MPKDFANKTRPSRGRNHKRGDAFQEKNTIHVKLKWFVGGVASGVILSLVIYLWFLPSRTNQEELKLSVLAEPKQSTKKNKGDIEEETLFEFYDILPSQSLETNNVERGNEQNAVLKKNYTYFLQAGAFKQKKDAESRRAELMLLDLDPTINAVSINDGQLHRVSIGPVESIQEIKKIQNLIENDGIKTVIKKRMLPTNNQK